MEVLDRGRTRVSISGSGGGKKKKKKEKEKKRKERLSTDPRPLLACVVPLFVRALSVSLVK